MITHKYNLAPEFKLALKDCDEVWIAVALMSVNGLAFIQKHINKEAKQHYLVGIDLPTPPDVLVELMNRKSDNQFDAKYFQKENRFFHPKLYLIKDHRGLTAFVGSGNCTDGGLENNIEISLKTDDKVTCDTLIGWFNTHYKQGKDLTVDFIEPYRLIYLRRKERLDQDKKDMQQIFGGNAIDLDNIDFTDQFFKKEHFAAFEGLKPFSYKPEIDMEREAVRTQLYVLHHMIEPLIKAKKWDLHRHYEFPNVVSSAVHNSHTSEDLDGIWLHYGRGEKEIKGYDKNETPINFMRMQVIIHKDSVGIWNRIGRDRYGSKIDRNHFADNLSGSQSFRNDFFDVMHRLPEGYFIEMNNKTRYVNEFPNEELLSEYLLTDNRKDYFYLGKNFPPGDDRLSKTNIVNTIMENFALLYPTYQLILHKMPANLPR
jgi:HKD family nuclease